MQTKRHNSKLGVVRRNSKLIVTALVILVALALGLGAQAAFLLGLLVASVMGVIGWRWSVLAGIICLAGCLLLLLYDRATWLQQSPLVDYFLVNMFGVGIYTTSNTVNATAIAAYYFLAIGVIAYISGRARLSRDRRQRSNA